MIHSVVCVGTAGYFVHSLLSRCALQLFLFFHGALWSRPPWSFYLSQCPMSQKFLKRKALLCGGEALRAIRAHKKCRHVRKNGAEPPLRVIWATSGPRNDVRYFMRFFYDVAGRSTPLSIHSRR